MVEVLKRCSLCAELVPRSGFYKGPGMADGLISRCKECTKRRVAEHRAANIEAVRAYDRTRAKEPGRRARSKKVSDAWRERGPAARAAHCLVAHALRDGRLSRGKCEACGGLRVHAHHDDYLRPLDVRWLCAEHHRAWHLANGPGLNASALTRRQELAAAREAQNDTDHESKAS